MSHRRVFRLSKSPFPRGVPRRAVFLKSGLAALALVALAPAETQNAVANGDTRTISLYHSHTKESITATFRVNGAYDYATLEKLNWFLRDWRRDEPTKMDPRLFDAIWETYRESGSQQPIVVVSAYRSPETNAMLRRRSRAVAEFSQHMLGKAMDMHYQDVPMSRVREIAMHLQRGGVGYYPTAGSPFVHMDVGSVRAWPRMSYEQLARLFPDGKTVHLPSNGQPLARYEEARAEIEARNGISVPTVAQVQSKGFFASLFGGGEDEEAVAPVRGGPRVGGDARVAGFIDRSRGTNAATRLAARGAPGEAPSPASADDNSTGAFFVADAARRSPAVERAERDLPRGQTYLAPAPVVVASATPDTRKPTVLPEPAVVAKPTAPEIADVVAAPAPVPPRRPMELAFAAIESVVAPLPPPRPAELARPSRVAELPNVITTGGAAPVAASTAGALAYAPTIASLISLSGSAPAPAKPVATRTSPAPALASQALGQRTLASARKGDDETAARIDRSNFRALTAPVEVASLAPGSVAPVVTGLRRASRTDVMSLALAPASGAATRFEPAGKPAPKGFTKAAPASRERASLTTNPGAAQLN